MVADPKLAMDITQIGAMTSIFPIAYGMSKFVSGVLGARFSPSVLLAGGLMATALINIAFGFGTSLAWFCFFWALNGTLQVSSLPCPPLVCSPISVTSAAGGGGPRGEHFLFEHGVAQDWFRRPVTTE